MRVVLVIVFVCWVVGRLCAEIPDFDYVQASERIVDLLSEDDAVVDYEALYDMLFRLSQQPVNLGSPHADELDKLFFLSELQRENLAYYLYRTGGMRSMYELQLVPGIDRFMVGLLRPFVVVSPSDSPYHKALPDFSNALTRADHQIDMRVMRRFDFSNVGALSKNSFGVLPYDFMLRYRFNVPNRLWVNISALHDAGEPFWNRYQRGFEAYHVALEYRGQKWLERFVVGD